MNPVLVAIFNFLPLSPCFHWLHSFPVRSEQIFSLIALDVFAVSAWSLLWSFSCNQIVFRKTTAVVLAPCSNPCSTRDIRMLIFSCLLVLATYWSLYVNNIPVINVWGLKLLNVECDCRNKKRSWCVFWFTDLRDAPTFYKTADFILVQKWYCVLCCSI